MKHRIVIGISGGIAAFKVLDLIKTLQQKDINVDVIETEGASFILKPEDIEKITNRLVYSQLFERNFDYHEVLEKREVEHIKISNSANLIVIAPATANIIAKLAHGIADDYLTTTALAATCPILICPSMNVYMWTNPVTQENLRILERRGYHIIHPDKGMLACGYEGVGRLAKIETIVDEIEKYLVKTDRLKNKKIIVTAGGTKEKIDDVRFITNNSSGKMGAAIAESLYLQGADVLFIHSKTSVIPRYAMKEKVFDTAEELEHILQKEVVDADAIFHSAAVSDFTVENGQKGKFSSNEKMILTLSPREKILPKFKQWNPQLFVVGFKAAWDVSDAELEKVAKEKLTQSQADVIIANDVSKQNQGFEVDTNEVLVVTKESTTKIPFNSKTVIAEKIIDILMSSRTE